MRVKAGDSNTCKKGPGFITLSLNQPVHHVSTPLTGAKQGLCPTPLNLGQGTEAGTGTKGGLI